MPNITVDWHSKTPLAEQLSAIIRRRYVQGAAVGDRLPTEHQLAAEFGVNRTIARRAVELLRKDGVVLRRPRHGTFIAAGAKKPLALAYFEERKYSFADLLDRFERACPAVRLERIALPVNGYCEITRQMMADGKLDLLRISASLFHGYDAAAEFMSLNGLGRKYAALTHTAPWSAFRLKKTRYGLPLAFGPVVVAYNRDLFRAAGVDFPEDGWTLAEFADKAARLTRSPAGASQPEQYGFVCPNLISRWMIFVYSHGGRLWDAARGNFALTAPAGVAGLNFLREMIEQKTCAPLLGVADPYRLFVRGKAAMTLISYHTMTTLRPAIRFDWDVAPFPASRHPACLMIVDGLAIARTTANLDAVVTFLDFCLGDEAQRCIAAQRGPVPARTGLDLPASASAPAHYNLYESLVRPACFPELPLGDHRERVAADETMLYVNGMQSAAEFCTNLASSANSLTRHEELTKESICKRSR